MKEYPELPLAADDFKKSDRLLKRSEFLALAESGEKVHGRHFLLIHGANARHRTRVGITVTRKVGCAVTRNRIKRWVREFYRTHKDWFQGAEDINVIAKRSAAGITSGQAHESLRNLFGRIRSRI